MNNIKKNKLDEYYYCIIRDNEVLIFYKENIMIPEMFLVPGRKRVYIDRLENKDTILQMMFSRDKLDLQLAYEILKTNGCITECNKDK